jgi:chromosome partitioning protein
MSRIVCIASQKGGTGKTTTAVNLSASLALLEKRTLLVDFDPQGNAATSLGIDKRALGSDVSQALAGISALRDVIVRTRLEFLDFAPARFGLFAVEDRLVKTGADAFGFRSRIEVDAGAYDFIIIDSPPSIRYLTLCAMAAADFLLIPIQPGLYTLEGLGQLLHVAGRIRASNRFPKIGGILLTMCNGNSADGKAREILEKLGSLLFSTSIPLDPRLAEAADGGMPLALLDLTSKGAGAYLDLAREIVERFAVPETGKAAGPLIEPIT